MRPTIQRGMTGMAESKQTMVRVACIIVVSLSFVFPHGAGTMVFLNRGVCTVVWHFNRLPYLGPSSPLSLFSPIF